MIKRLIVKWEGGYCNVAVTRIETERGYTIAWLGDELAGVFDNEYVQVLYLSEPQPRGGV